MTTKLVDPIIQAHVAAHGEKLREVWVHNRYMFSSVAQFAIELFKQEMALEVPVTANIPLNMSYQPTDRATVEESVQRACDGAEKLYTEMLRRGWMQEMPPLKDCIERGDFTFGMTGGHRGKDQAG